MLEWLLKFGLGRGKFWEVRKNEGYRDQKTESMTPEEKWWFVVLTDGELPMGSDGLTSCPKDKLTDHYLEHSRRVGYGRRANQTKLGMFLNKVAPGLKATQEGVKKIPTWTFPILKDCRAKMTEKMGQEMNWD